MKVYEVKELKFFIASLVKKGLDPLAKVIKVWRTNGKEN